MARALYRRYRPRTLAEVVGQEQVTKPLSEAIRRSKVSHAYLFVGPRGTGKTSVARIFAHEINHFDYDLEDNYIDIIEIDGASNRGIDDIRELREKAAIAPSEGEFKIYIIDEVHMLTKEAFNALLKTLEEPPEHVVFIMATTDVQKVPNTIISRAQLYTFQLADATTMQKYLRKIADTEKIAIDDAALEIIVERGGGSFRDSLSLLDQISTLSDEQITADLVISAMGLPSAMATRELLECYRAADLSRIGAKLRELLANGTKPEILVEDMIRQIIAEPEPELLDLLSRLSNITAPFVEAKLLVALCFDLHKQPAPRPQAAAAAPKEPVAAPPILPNFSWDDFCEQLKELNDTVYEQLAHVSHELINGTLDIYPQNASAGIILGSRSNRELMASLATGVRLEVHKYEHKEATMADNGKNPSANERLSDIIGGEVKEYGGENPFAE